MSYAYQIHKQDAAYFLTPTAVEWADAFMRREHKQIICDSLNYCVDVKRLEIFAYVIMSSHMHMIARAKEGNLSDIIRDFKKFTSAMLIKDFRTSTESRSGWMLDLFKAGGEKQKKKSSMQLWQYIIMRWKFTVRNLQYQKYSTFTIIQLKPDWLEELKVICTVVRKIIQRKKAQLRFQ